eukprot:s694_g12.t4
MKPSPAFEAAPHWITVGEQGDPEGSELERQWDECFEGMLSRRDAEPSSSKLVRHNRYDAMARGLKTAQWMSNGALAAAVKVGANRRMRLRCEQEDLMNELHCERQAAEELQTELSSEMRELRDRCQEQGQTVGLLTQRLADARSAIAAELQDAAAERAALGAELSEESQRNRLQAAMLHEEAEATSRVEAYEQQLASMVTVRDSLQAQLEAALRVQTELREHLAAERDGRAELEVAGEREMLAWEKNKEMTHSPGTELQSLGTIHTAKLGNHLPRIFGKINRPTRVSEEPQKSAEEEAPPAPQKKQPPLEAPKLDDSVLAEAKLVVESIRADRLVNCEWEEGITDEVKAGLLGMRRSLCAAVERLAMDLYADECHCLWELIQNADDNKYASEVEVPELCLSMEVDASLGAYVWTSNNEIGLSREDVRAICNVNASMKGAGQTGHKGIGWKSVFRISDCPHVLSREFAFKFDTAGPLGQLAYVTPTNLTDEEIESLPSPVKEAKAAGRTVMFLPLRSVSDAPAVEAELKQIAAQHLCLAFLRRLRRLQLCFPDGRRMTLERCQAQFAELYFPAASDVTAVKITDAHKAQEPRIQMPAYVLHHQSVTWEDEAEAEGGESTAKLSLAFPASFASREDDADEDESELLQVPLQALFTFLPVKVVGFRFAIQGPFDLTADRANLHGKSSRNRALCSAIPMAFRTALEQLPSLRRNALDLLGQETPEAAWLLVRGELLEVLREVACIPTEPEGALARPGECLLPPEEQKLAEAMQHLPSDVLWARCRRRLVRKKWAQSHRAQCRALGLKEISIDDWLHVLGVAAQGEDLTSETTRSLVEEAAGKQDHGFFRRVFALLGSNVTDKPEVLDQLKTVPLIPDAAGHALRIVDGPTFSNHAGDVPLEWQNALEAAGALRVLSPAVQTALDSVGQRLLRQLGVTRPTRHDIVPLCVRWHTSLSPESARSSDDPKSADHEQEEAHPNRQGNLQCGGSSGSDAAPRQDVEPVDQHARAKSGDCQQPAPLDKATLRSGVWASLACLRNHFLTGAAGAPHEKGGEMVPWRELGNGLLFPCSSRRSGFGPCQRLTCPTYFGEAVGSELQHDVLVAIMGFIHGIEAEAHDIGVCSDPPPPWLRDEKEKVSESKDALTTDRLNWEAFLDDLGLKPLSPCTSHRKVAGTILTIDLGWRLSSSDWWKAAAASKAALAYLERRLKEADRLEITWLKQLRTPERVDVAELFLRSAYVRYGGHFLPYMDLPQTDAPVASLACLRRLGVATDLTGSGLRKCLQVLEGRACQDLSVFADIYAALASLPKDEQASTGSWGSQEAPGDARVFLPPATFRKAGECVWTDHGKSTLRWLCGYVALQPDYGRFGNLCRSWLVGPHVAIKHDLEALEFDEVVVKLHAATESLIRSSGHVQSTKAEIELLTQVEVARKFMIASLHEPDDRKALHEVFGGDLARVCRVALEQLDSVVSPSAGQRLSQCLMACRSIEDVLADLGLSRALLEAEEEQRQALAERHAKLGEPGSCRGCASPDDPDAASPVAMTNPQIHAIANDFFICAGEIRDAADSDEQDEAQLQSFTKRLSELASDIVTGAGGAMTDARARAVQLPTWLGEVAAALRSYASAFLGALRSLIRQADAASRIAPSDRQKRLAGSDSPTAAALLHELQDVAVQAYKHLAKCCRAATGEDRSRVQGSIALAFQHEALLILTDKEWDKPKRLKSLEAFWDVHADVASSKASKLALKNRLPAEDLDELKTFFVDIVGIPERLSQQDLEARLRVPLSQAPEQQSSWNEGFGLNDFEDIATIRRGPGVVGQAGEGDDFFQPADDLPEGAATYGSGSTGRTAYDTRVSGPDEAGVSSTSGPAASSSEPAGAANTSAPRSSDEPPADSPAGDPEQAASSQEPSASSQQPGQTLPDEPEEEEEDAFDWESEDACDPYKVLRVDKDADEETIRRSYKKLALKYHPDKNQGSETAQKRFQAISAAYDILRDPEKRKAYDKAAARAKAQKSQASQVRPPSMSPEEAREVFRDFFGGRDPFDAAFRNQPPKRAEGAASSSSDAFRVSDAAPSSAPSSSQGSGKSTTSSSRSYRRPKHRLGCGARRWKWRASSFARRRRPGIGTCEFCKIAMTAPAREAREDSDGSRGAKQSALWLTEGPWHQELHQNDGLRSLNGLCVVSTEKNLSTGSGALLF